MTNTTISRDKWFYFVGGKSAKDIEELISRIKEITGEEFEFHVNGAKNDFANWIEGVFNLKDLADELRRVMEKKDSIHILKRYLHQQKALLPGFTKEELIEHVPHELLEYRPAKQIDLEKHASYLSSSKNYSALNDSSGDVAEDYDKEARELAKQLHFDDQASSSGEYSFDARKLNSDKKYLVSSEHDITGTELNEIAVDASRELKIDGRSPVVLHAVEHHDPEHHGRFIVKEFIYGFIIGLIFGLIMLGTLLNRGGLQ